MLLCLCRPGQVKQNGNTAVMLATICEELGQKAKPSTMHVTLSIKKKGKTTLMLIACSNPDSENLPYTLMHQIGIARTDSEGNTALMLGAMHVALGTSTRKVSQRLC